MVHRIRLHGWNIAVAGAVSGAVLIAPPLMSTAAASSASVRTTSAPAVGNTYGGVTSQGQPVIVDMKANRRQIVRAVAAVDLTCTSGAGFAVPDKYTQIPVSKKGKFVVSFGPITQRNDDGTTTDIEGRMSGTLNRAGTWISGTWTLTATEHDTAGAVTDSCTTGSVRWKAKQ